MLGFFNWLLVRFGAGTAYRVFAWAPLVALVLGGAAGVWLGHTLARAPLLLELAHLRTAQAETAKLQALARARELQAAQARGDQLTHSLAQSQAQITQLKTEKHRAINRLVTGRPCLSADAVSVLNSAHNSAHPAAGFVDVPAPTGSAAAGGAAFATDADVGHWVASAQAQYDTCRKRLDALIDWHNRALNGGAKDDKYED